MKMETQILKENAPHKFLLSELMLYVHFRDEEKEFQPDNPEVLENIYKENFDRIKKIKS